MLRWRWVGIGAACLVCSASCVRHLVARPARGPAPADEPTPPVYHQRAASGVAPAAEDDAPHLAARAAPRFAEPAPPSLYGPAGGLPPCGPFPYSADGRDGAWGYGIGGPWPAPAETFGVKPAAKSKARAMKPKPPLRKPKAAAPDK